MALVFYTNSKQNNEKTENNNGQISAPHRRGCGYTLGSTSDCPYKTMTFPPWPVKKPHHM